MIMEAVEEVQCIQPVGPAALGGERNEPQRSVPNPTPTTTTTPAGAVHLYHYSGCPTCACENVESRLIA